MQLNPARGRKLKIVLDIRYDWISPVYAAQPREGTETQPKNQASDARTKRFMQLNPARGRKRDIPIISCPKDCIWVYAAQPREGTETSSHSVDEWDEGALVYAAQPREGTETTTSITSQSSTSCHGLCSSTPRGDGNALSNSNTVLKRM